VILSFSITSVSGGEKSRKNGEENPIFYTWGSAPNPALAVRQEG